MLKASGWGLRHWDIIRAGRVSAGEEFRPMPRPLTVPPSDEATRTELHCRVGAAADPETTQRLPKVWLAHWGRRAP